MNEREFVERVRHLFPGAKDLAELAETLKMLRDMPAPAATLIKLRFFNARVVELSEEGIIWRRRAEGKPAITWSPELSPPPSHWGPPPKAPVARQEPIATSIAPEPAQEVETPPDVDLPPPRQQFRAVRLRLGLSQAAFAERLGQGWTSAMVSQIETARRPCPADVLARIEAW